MKIKFKKILPILGLLSIGVAAPIISTACSSTSETPSPEQPGPGEPTPPGGEGTKPEETTEIKVNFTEFNKVFAALDDVGYGELSQHIDPTNNNQVEQGIIGDFITSLGFSKDDADKFEKITVSLKEKPASQGGGEANASLFAGTGGEMGWTGVTPKKLLNAEAEIVMTLKENSIWNEKDLPSNASVSNEKKTLTLKDVETKVQMIEYEFSIADGTNLKKQIENDLKKLTEGTDEKLLEIAKTIQDSLNGLSQPNTNTISSSQPSDTTKPKYVRKVVVKLVEDNQQPATSATPSAGTGTFKKANVTIFFGENVSIKFVTTGAGGGTGVGSAKEKTQQTEATNEFQLYENSKSAITTSNPIDTGINANPNPQGQK